jgi:hypothetical protein
MAEEQPAQAGFLPMLRGFTRQAIAASHRPKRV